MTYKTKNTVKLGFFILIGFLLFVVAVYLIGTNKNMFGASLRINTIFSNVNGLQPGNNVRYSGINVGTVEQIIFLNDTTLQVKMKLKNDAAQYIRKNVIASIGSDGLVGSMLVNISPGKGEASLIEHNDTIASYSRVETDEMLNTLGKTNENIALISNNLLEITKQIKKGGGTFSLLLQDTSLATDIKFAISNIRVASAQLSTISREFRGLVKKVEEGDGLLNQLLTDTLMLPKLDRSISSLDTLINQEFSPTLANLNKASTDMKSAGKNLKTLLEDLEAGQGTAGLLLRDSSTAQNIRDILLNLESSTEKLDENMEAMRENFLFRRYFKKLEKEKAKH